MIIAYHRGVWSLGLLLVIGSATTLIAALGVLPTLVRLTGEKPESAAVVTPGSSGISQPQHPAERNEAGSIRERITARGSAP
jgi:hypothetical protein